MSLPNNHIIVLQESQQQRDISENKIKNESSSQSEQGKEQSNSQEDYELIPRQTPVYASPLKDVRVQFRSKPFVYKRMIHVNNQNTNNKKQSQDVLIITPSLQGSLKQQQLEASLKFSGSKKKFDQMRMKQVQSEHDIQPLANEQNGQRGDKEGRNIERENTNLEDQITINSHPIVSIKTLSSEHDEIEEVIAKYHFQTQKHFSQEAIKLQHDRSLQFHEDSNVTFSQNEKKYIQNDLNYTFSPKKSMEKIDHFRKKLLKSTDDCQVADMVDKINKKVGQVCKKVENIERKRFIEMKQQLQRRKILSEEKKRRQFVYESRGDNVMLDLGGSAKEGKIIAIYPSSKMTDVKDLMFGQNEKINPSKRSGQQQNTLKIMRQMQQQFISTLKEFQISVDQSLKLKLQEIRKAYEQNSASSKQSAQKEQKQQRISQQTSDKQEDHDDSRGSINVLYLRKLRELQGEIREKQWRIQRLEKDNYYMEKQLEKVHEVGFVKQTRESMGQVLSPLKNNEAYCNVLSFSNKRKANHYVHNPVNSLQQNINQQRMKQFSSQNVEFKKKSTHSFHHYESKTIQSKQFIEMKQKLSQCQVLIKEKDLRIKELENTIMDHLENSGILKKDAKQHNQSEKSSKISGYYSIANCRQEENIEVLHMKINNLKTLLNQSKAEVQNYKRLYDAEKVANPPNLHSNQHIKFQNAKIIYDDKKSNTNTSRSLCVSDKTTIKNDRHFANVHVENSPLIEIIDTPTVGQKRREISSYGKQTIFESLINQNGTISIITGVLVNFIMMAWSLKEVITKLCGNEVNVEKINRNARQFLFELKAKDQNVWKKVWLKLDEGQFDSRIKEIWNQ